jgi:hypothetical protein
MNFIGRSVLLAVLLTFIFHDILHAQKMHGDLRQWHRVVIDFQGPPMSESAVPETGCGTRLDMP